MILKTYIPCSNYTRSFNRYTITMPRSTRIISSIAIINNRNIYINTSFSRSITSSISSNTSTSSSTSIMDQSLFQRSVSQSLKYPLYVCVCESVSFCSLLLLPFKSTRTLNSILWYFVNVIACSQL